MIPIRLWVKSASSKRVVMRTSLGTPPQKVHAHILTPAIEIKAQQLHHLLAQFGLFGGREGTLRLDEGLLFLFFANLSDQAGEPPFEFAEQGVESGAVHPWLVELKQTVVGA